MPGVLGSIKRAGVISFRNNARAGSFKVVELTGTLPSFSVHSKIKTLIYQSFILPLLHKNAILGNLLLRSAHNSGKWHFNALFGLFYSEFIPNFIPN